VRLFEQMCRVSEARGGLVTDACLAALALETGPLLVSVDRDFERYPGSRWENLAV
jgi:predicted nucleic acid-binding protein